jgi:protein phosphatase
MRAEVSAGIQAAKAVLTAYKPLLALDRSQCEEIGRAYALPTFEEDIVSSLCEAARKQFERTEPLIHLTAPFYVIGDIHGNIFDLLRILILVMPPPRSRLLFLGDYVDRGEYSVEVVTLLFSLYIRFPESIVLLRGNHEFETMNRTYGFYSEVTSQYSSDMLYGVINDTFSWMPLVAVLNNQIFCVHGGISPHLTSLSQLKAVKRPMVSYDGDFVPDLLWSDPCFESKTYDGSSRGLGVQFGLKALQDFLAGLNMKTMLRAHQCILAGISRFGTDELFTVFSCSRYEGQDNRCGLLFVDQSLHIDFFSLPPLEQIPRITASLKKNLTAQLIQDMEANDSLAMVVKLQEIKATTWKGSIQRLSVVGDRRPFEQIGRSFSSTCPKKLSILPPLEAGAFAE